MNFFAASWEGLLVLIGFMVVSALANWLKGKRQPEEDTETLPKETERPPVVRRAPARTVPAPSPQPKALDWEEELRRLLGEHTAAPAPPPPIIVRETAPSPARPPVWEEAPAPSQPLATFRESSAAHQHALQLDEKVEERMRQRAAMSESAAAYQQAARLDTTVEEHMRQVTEQPVSSTRVIRRGAGTPEIAQTVALLRHPRTARQAILAAVILGPPKALEMQGG